MGGGTLKNLAVGSISQSQSAYFPLAAVREVKIGAGWARRGMWLLLLPYFKGIDSMATGLAVSFIAPADTAGGGVYAPHMRTSEDAQALASLLTGA
jgi:hypothetical protein